MVFIPIDITENSENCSYTFFYLYDLDEEKRKKNELEKKANTDALMGVYNISDAKEKIDEYLYLNAKGKMHAFFMVDLDNFKTVDDTSSSGCCSV